MKNEKGYRGTTNTVYYTHRYNKIEKLLEAYIKLILKLNNQ
jgi:hypothetical protein